MQPFLRSNVCLVTGGAQGIGWAITQALADHGGEVYACDVSADFCAQAEAALPDLPWGERIHIAQCDVTDRAAVEAWVHGVHRATGHIDVLVNNAAFVRWKRVEETTLAEMEKMMAVGYFGMVKTTLAALPLMLAGGRQGTIVNLGSSAGKIFARGGSAPYAAVKAAIEAFTAILRIELEATPIHVLLVRPGLVAGTSFFRDHVESFRMPRFTDFVPLVTPPDIAEGVLRGIARRRRAVNVPGYLKAWYVLAGVAPRLTNWLVRLGGHARSDFGVVDWTYEPRADGGE